MIKKFCFVTENKNSNLILFQKNQFYSDDDSDTATEGEEEVRARELRKQEVKLDAPDLDTGSDTEVNTSSEAEDKGSEPPDVVRDSNTSASPELLSDISSPSTNPPLPAPRRKNNSFRITASSISLSKPKVITIRNNSNENQVNNAAPVLPLRKTKSSKNKTSKKSSPPPLSPLEEKFLMLRLNENHLKREKFFNDASNRSSPTNKSDMSVYGTPLASPATTPDNPLKSISHIVEKANSTPNSEKCIKSILVSKIDKKLSSAKDKTNPHNSKDCTVM